MTDNRFIFDPAIPGDRRKFPSRFDNPYAFVRPLKKRLILTEQVQLFTEKNALRPWNVTIQLRLQDSLEASTKKETFVC